MDAQHENRSSHRSTIQQLLDALNEELSIQSTSGQLASDPEQLLRIEYQTRHALSKICSSKNTFPRINRLPPEVLALIPFSFNSYDSYWDIVKITHVCRHWRNTFIASPPLWSSLDNHAMHQDLLAMFVDRCGAAPLDVTFNSKLESKNFPFLKSLVPRSAHIRKMRFPDLHWRHIAELSNEFDRPLPMLREVAIDASCSGSEAVPPPFERPFLAEATNLASLYLFDCNWQSGTLLHFVIPTLTQLKVQFYGSRTTTIGELLELLRNSPRLEHIRIDARTVQDVAEEGSAFLDPVDLPHLHNIYLSWTTSRSQCTLLAHIKYPPTCFVSMQVKSTGQLAQPPQDAFPKSWEAFSLPNISSVTIRITREEMETECVVVVKKLDGASISVSHLEHLGLLISFDDDHEPVVDENRDRDDNHLFSAAISFVRELPLHSIKEFALEGLRADEMFNPELFEIPPDLVELICSDLPHLTTLSLTNTCVSELFTILAPPPPPPPMYIADLFEEGGTSESNLPCPTLKVLEMRHPEWEPKRHCPEAIALAKARWSEGVPFERVFIRSFVVPESMAKGMSSYVDDVDIRYGPSYG